MIHRKRNRKIKVPKYLYIVSLGLLLFLSVGYSMINSTLGIEGNVVASKNNWDIHFDNITYADDSIKPEVSPSIVNETELNYNVSLERPGDKLSFTFDIVNNGSLDGIIDKIDFTSLTDDQKKYINYEITYENGNQIQLKDILRKEEIKKVKVLLEYKDKRSNDEYPEENIELPLKIFINYIQAKEEVYKLDINHNNIVNSYSVINTKEALKIPDEIAESDNAIICNNNSIPTISDTNELIITNIKQNTSCSIVKTLKDAIDLIENENNYITLLNNLTINEAITIPKDKSVIINLSNKEINFNGNETLITNEGNLIINASSSSIVNTSAAFINNKEEAKLTINNGIYNKLNSTNINEAIIIGGGLININKVSMTSDSNTLILDKENSIINIEESILISNNNADSNIINKSNNSIINIYSSEIIGEAKKAIVNEKAGNIYLCNTKVKAKEFDISSTNKKVFYSKNSTFTNNDNNPLTENNNSIRSDIACKKY